MTKFVRFTSKLSKTIRHIKKNNRQKKQSAKQNKRRAKQNKRHNRGKHSNKFGVSPGAANTAEVFSRVCFHLVAPNVAGRWIIDPPDKIPG